MQYSPSPPSILVPLQRLVPKISVLNRAPRPPTLANSGGPNPLKLCSLRRAWSLQTPDFLPRPQLLRLEISAESRSIRPLSPSSQTLLSSRCSPCTSANLQRLLHYKASIPIPNSGHLSTFPLSNFSSESFLCVCVFYSALFLRLIHSPQLPDHLVASCSPTSGSPKLTRHPPRSGDLKPLRALPLTFAQAVSARRSPPLTRPARKRMFRPVFKRSPAPSSLLVIASKVPPPELPAPPPCPAALVFIPPVTRGSGKPEVGGAGRGRKVKGTECLSFLRLTGFSTALGRRCIVGSRRRACDARIRRGAHLLAPPVVCKVALLFLGTSTPFTPPSPPPPPSSSSKWRRRRQRRRRWLLRAARVRVPTSP